MIKIKWSRLHKSVKKIDFEGITEIKIEINRRVCSSVDKVKIQVLNPSQKLLGVLWKLYEAPTEFTKLTIFDGTKKYCIYSSPEEKTLFKNATAETAIKNWNSLKIETKTDLLTKLIDEIQNEYANTNTGSTENNRKNDSEQQL